MEMHSQAFLENAREALGDPEKARRRDLMAAFTPMVRNAAMESFGKFEPLRQHLRRVRQHTLDNLDHYLDRLREKHEIVKHQEVYDAIVAEYREFAAAFPFDETPDQQAAIEATLQGAQLPLQVGTNSHFLVEPKTFRTWLGQRKQPLVHHPEPETWHIGQQVHAEIAVRQPRQILVVPQ